MVKLGFPELTSVVLPVAVTEAGAFCAGGLSCLHCPAQLARVAAESRGRFCCAAAGNTERSCCTRGLRRKGGRLRSDPGTTSSADLSGYILLSLTCCPVSAVIPRCIKEMSSAVHAFV